MHNSILVTGGAGFIGSNFVLQWLGQETSDVVNLDRLTYAGNLGNLASLQGNPRHRFVAGDIGDRALVAELLQKHRPSAIVHFAAESHVDRSIVGPEEFVRTNVNGTFALLDEARHYWLSLGNPEKQLFRFLHISTDEVYGSLRPADAPFSEASRYAPNSPYAASKAASDHMVRAYFHTYGLPTITTNCSNNYGPHQFPEKLIPLMILNALKGDPLPVYGNGENVRDWLYVADHCRGIRLALSRGKAGETYNFGGRSERRNIDVVLTLCAVLDELIPESKYIPHRQLIQFVADRPGHDWRYAVDISKSNRELGFSPEETFESGLGKTVDWYLKNSAWVETVTSGSYREWIDLQYGDRKSSEVKRERA